MKRAEWHGDQPPTRRMLSTPQRLAVLARLDAFEQQHGSSVARFLSLTEVAHYLGYAGPDSLNTFTVPSPDALVGKTKGWLPTAVIAWNTTWPISQVANTVRCTRFLSRTEVSEILGLASVNSMAKYVLPGPDAVVDKIEGWLPTTIEAWNAARPGRGRHR